MKGYYVRLQISPYSERDPQRRWNPPENLSLQLPTATPAQFDVFSIEGIKAVAHRLPKTGNSKIEYWRGP
jgi:hypothetical protein